MVDAYNMYVLEFTEYHRTDELQASPTDFRSFVEEIGVNLSRGLLHDKPGHKRTIHNISSQPYAGLTVCGLDHLNKHPSKKKVKHFVQACCVICGEHDSWYCTGCSSDTVAVPLCGMATKRSPPCFLEHQSQVRLSRQQQ